MSNQYRVVSSPVLYPETVEAKSGYKVLDTHENLRWLLQHFDAEIRYNLMTRRREVKLGNQFIFRDDSENSSLSRVKYLATLNGMPIKQVDLHLDYISQECAYHPIVECLEKKPWDGVKRLDDFIATITAANPELAKKIIFTWMMAAMAAAHSENGFINQGVLVLQGEQKIGKTTWVRSLDPINCGASKESTFLDPTNKDSIAQLATLWIAELGELETIFRKSEIGRLKSFITTEYDYLRLPYAPRPIRLARRTVYVATVNHANFLSDDTGNRRWWTVEVKSINLNHGLDMQQVWAEACQYWKEGAATDLDFESQAEVNINNVKHEHVESLKEQILTHYDWSSTCTRWMTSTMVLQELGYSKPNKSDTTKVGMMLRQLSPRVEVRRNISFYEVSHFIPKGITP